ncbi:MULTISPECIES: hypothetical protein [Streptosporangium]|uniref:Peptidase M15A C-terminal domain-containing protein n=1 Tax=Streptosporangium brasiliense TaxID=47480 RepID=A0ABT9R459_9ACTN|nr:hypothetical protein [Streptosporangium brasiliense]MDP9864015.1 hypothetical protein [Streptosporangium brasiliense]
MGTRPCKQRRARLTAGALLALQISLIALASHGTAAADSPRPSIAVTAAGAPAAVRPARLRATAVGAYDAGVLAAARRYARSLYRQASAVSTAGRPGGESGRPGGKSAPGQPVRLGHAQATQLLRNAGLRWMSSGGCSNRRVGTCTSLEAVRAATVENVIALKRRSGCPVVVTGGTEVGHAPGRYSHHRGYKLDIELNPCINGYITREHVLDGVRGDGAALYRDEGTVYARESDHWDILFL